MNQKELKQLYADILAAEVWPGDQHMIDFCVKSVDHIVELSNGDIVAIDKPTIQKDFCFGYSLSRYDTEDYDDAAAMARHARSSEDYFLRENLRGLDQQIEEYTNAGTDSRYTYRLRSPYYRLPQTSRLKGISVYKFWEEEAQQYPELSAEDRARMIDGYRTVRSHFEKRLKTYLKRYGMSKINTWTYWRDE